MMGTFGISVEYPLHSVVESTAHGAVRLRLHRIEKVRLMSKVNAKQVKRPSECSSVFETSERRLF